MKTTSPAALAYVIRASAVASLGGLLFGYDTAVIAGTVELLQTRFALSDLMLGWTVSSALVGCMLGALAAGPLGERIGRKYSLLVCAILFLISAVWSAVPSSAPELVLARIVGGLGVGAASMLTPVYISEIAPAPYRGALTTLNQIAILLGMVAVYLVNAWLATLGDGAWQVAMAWRWMFASEAVPAALFLVLLFFVPESPRWLALRGRQAEAFAILSRTGDGAEERVASILSGREEPKGGLIQGLEKSDRRRFLIAATLAVLQQITGINIVMYYAPRIFTNAGIDTTSAIGHSVIIGLVMLGFTIVTLLLADRVGRRPLLLLSTAGMTCGLAALGLAYSHGAHADGQNLLVWVIVYVAAFSLGMGPLTWTVLAEIFPNRLRAQAAGACIFLLWLANFLVSQFFPWLLSKYDYLVFWMFGGLCFITLVFVWGFIPETKGRSLEDLEDSNS